MEPQRSVPQDTTFFQEYQPVYNAADLRGQFSRLRIHGLFLASKNRDVKKSRRDFAASSWEFRTVAPGVDLNRSCELEEVMNNP